MEFIIAQAFGILAMVMNVASYQAKKQKTVIIMQLFGSLFFTVNMIMLSATMGAILNIIGVARALVYSNKDKIKHIKAFNYIFISLYVLSYIATFTIFSTKATAFNLIVEFLPVIGMTATNIGFSLKSAADIRKVMLISSPMWLAYHGISLSLGGVLCEIFTLVSVFIGMLRYDIKKKQN